jgi:sugar fermentation stimulation protein A
LRSKPETIYRFPRILSEGRILSRPNRFIMLVRAGRGTLKCHCPTTGRLGNLKVEGLPCLFSTSTGRSRKTGYTVEAISTTPGDRRWIGINQTAANRYVEFFLRNGALARLASGDVRREVKLGKSRIDFLVGNAYVEVKTPLMALPAGPGIARAKRNRSDSFDRLIKHMEVLRDSLVSGKRAKLVLCFLYDARPFRPPPPSNTSSRVVAASKAAETAGVERWQVNLRVGKEGISLIKYFQSRPYSHG